ncbi:MAG: hypothetical protein V3U51_00590 [Thermoplasmata archaeon]
MSLESILVGVLVVLSFALFVTSVISYRRSGERRMALVAVAFLLILLKGILWTFGLFYSEIDIPTTFTLLAVFDVAVLVTFFVATLKPS